MIYSGLVSVTFRQFTPEEVIELAKKAGLDGIEWGGDKHVPHGDTDCAKRVLKLTKDAGLKVAAYGSYYRVGEQNEFSFGDVLKTAKALESPVIRVWAGTVGSSDANEEYWNNVVTDSQRITNAAKKENIQIAFEFHKKTLTDTNDSCLKLLKEINHDNIRTYWQPSQEMNVEERINGLHSILPYLSNIHVFHWVDGKKLPLESGAEEWEQYIEIIRQAPGERYAMLEFVRDNSVEQFFEDAITLKKLI